LAKLTENVHGLLSDRLNYQSKECCRQTILFDKKIKN